MSSTSNTNKNSHRSRASPAFYFPDTADYHEPGFSSTGSPRLQILSGTGSPCGEGSWISLSAKELLEEDYSEIEYSDMDGEDDMIYDTPPYYHYEDEHSHQQHPYPYQYRHQQQQLQHQQQQQPPSQSHPQQIHQGRSFAFTAKGDYTSFPSSSSASSSHHSLQEQEQVEEALRASLSTLLAAGPRPSFKQRRRRPQKIYTVDTRSQRSSPLVPASPTHLYYSTTTSPHLRPSNPESILGDLSPNYFHGSFTPCSSREYDSTSSDSEATRKQKASYRRRGILLAEQYTRDHYYEIESTTLNSNDPSSPTAPFSGSTTPLRSPPQCQANTSKPLPSDAVANNVLQGPSSLRAKEFASWSVKARSILDRTSKEQSFNLGEGCAPSSSSSWSSSPHTSPSASGSSTPVRIRRRRCPIPEPHQGFFSRALDQRSLASHVSVSRLGMGGTLYPPIHVGLHTGMLIRGSSPLRPSGGPSPPSFTPNSPTQQHANSFSSGSGINNESCHEDDVECWRTSPGSDDKENRRWYRQELGLNLWQTTLGAAALLGTGFGSGMIKKVHNNNVQLHSKELSRENTEIAV